jgi:hypothetical protein
MTSNELAEVLTAGWEAVRWKDHNLAAALLAMAEAARALPDESQPR